MWKALRSSLTYSNVVSSICLFLLLGGVAYAAAQLPKNSVGTKQLKNGAVTLKKLDNQVLKELKGFGPGPVVGPQGPKGDPGAPGSPGTPGSPGAPGQEGVGVDALFGSGADDGATLSGTGNTLSRDTYYDNLTLSPGAVLNTNGYRLFVAGTLTMEDGSNINRDGLDAVMGCGPWTSPLSSHTLGGAGAGGCNGSGGEGEDVTNSLGGDGGGSTNAGTAQAPANDVGGIRVFESATQALTGRSLDGELVYGGAGGETTTAIFGGGQGGGVVVIAARTVVSVGSTSITANGGYGDKGGGGGVVVVISTSSQPGGLTISAAGGENKGSGSSPEAGFAEWLD